MRWSARIHGSLAAGAAFPYIEPMTDLSSGPDGQAVDSNIAEFSRAVRERARKRLAKPGIKIRPKKDVPLFHVDDVAAGTFIRKLNGRVERGILENGEFKVIA